MKKDFYYCMVFSDEQLEYLSQSKYGIDRMKILACLVRAAVTGPTKCEKKGFSAVLRPGQAELPEVDLASRLGYDKKTVSRVLDKLSSLGIVTSEQTNRTSIHTIRCISAWYTGGQKILNPFYVNMKERHAPGGTPAPCPSRDETKEKEAAPADGKGTMERPALSSLFSEGRPEIAEASGDDGNQPLGT